MLHVRDGAPRNNTKVLGVYTYYSQVIITPQYKLNPKTLYA